MAEMRILSTLFFLLKQKIYKSSYAMQVEISLYSRYDNSHVYIMLFTFVFSIITCWYYLNSTLKVCCLLTQRWHWYFNIIGSPRMYLSIRFEPTLMYIIAYSLHSNVTLSIICRTYTCYVLTSAFARNLFIVMYLSGYFKTFKLNSPRQPVKYYYYIEWCSKFDGK